MSSRRLPIRSGYCGWMAKGAPSEHVSYAAGLRAAGATWTEIAKAVRDRFDLGALQAMRVAHGWTQPDVARRWQSRFPSERPLTVKKLSTWECWPSESSNPPGLRELARLAELYECDVTDLVFGLADFSHLDAYPDAVDRRDFLFGAASSAAALSASPLLPVAGARLGAGDVARIRTLLASLYAADDAGGGAATFERALNHAATVRRLLNETSYRSTVGRDLRVLAGELTEHAAWAAHDLRRHGDARRLWGEALTFANITGSPSLTSIVMAAMSLQAASHGAGREAVELAQAAQRVANAEGSARLLSLLASREARGHALAGDAQASGVALARAESLLEEDDGSGPEWLAFWGPADFHCAVGSAHMDLGAARAAERAFRSAIAVTPEHYARNRALYGGYLAEAFIAQGAIEEAADAATSAMSGVSSGRLRSKMLALRPAFEPHAAKPVVGVCLDRLATVA